MKSILVRRWVGLALWLAVSEIATAQNIEVDPKYKTADTNNAVIEGRVNLPSGFPAERNVRITLSNSQKVLFTRYSNQHGEFRFDDLSEGMYYVQAEIAGPDFEPVVERVALGRGIIWRLNLQLREKNLPLAFNASRVVSVAELRQSVPPSARKEYEHGLRLVSKGDAAQAALHFQEAIRIYPEYLAARNDLGAQYLKLKRIDEAEKHFQIVLERDPKNFNAKFNLGLVRIERKDFLDAISQLNQAITIDSTRAVARLWLGFALLETGALSSAEGELDKALVMCGAECVAAHYHLARIYLARGNSAEAARSLRAYLEEAPKGEYANDARELARTLKSEPARP